MSSFLYALVKVVGCSYVGPLTAKAICQLLDRELLSFCLCKLVATVLLRFLLCCEVPSAFLGLLSLLDIKTVISRALGMHGIY